MKSARLLRYARRSAGLTQRELSERTGVPQPAIARIERGRVSPTVPTLDRLVAATGHAIALMPRPGIGVDRTLIQAALARSPEERVLAAGAAGRNLAAFRSAADQGRRDRRG
ncbi:MAG: helix-turn-helix transcriptional regulator [Candidatus Limnocylindria bacterium]